MERETKKCYKCKKEDKSNMHTTQIEGVERIVCEDCIQKLQRKWNDFNQGLYPDGHSK